MFYYEPAAEARRVYHGSFNQSARTRYYTRHLLHKAMSVFKFTLPEEWAENYFLYTLFINGYIVHFNTAKYGVVALFGRPSGYDLYRNPVEFTVTNQAFNETYVLEVGKDCEVVALTPDYLGVMDVVNEYAELMANASAAINLNLYNSRLSYLFWAKNPKQAEAYKKVYDEVGTGLPAVMLDTSLQKTNVKDEPTKPFEPFTTDLKNNYIADVVIDDLYKLEQSFARKIGLPEANTLKRERQTTSEINKSDIDTRSNIILWEETVQNNIERTTKLFPQLKGQYKCELRFKPEVEEHNV